jgi:predicted Zn-dependent peptidase
VSDVTSVLPAGSALDSALARAEGVGLISLHSPYSQTACCLLFLSAGSWLDPPGRCGLAHVYEHAFFAGATGVPTAAQVADAAAGLGCRHNAHTYREYMYFYLSGPATTAQAAIDLLLACYDQPEPTAAELDKQRKAIFSELALFAGQRERRLRDLAAQALYAPDGLGRPPLGVAEDIAGIGEADLRWFARQAASRSRITLITDGPDGPDGLAFGAELAERLSDGLGQPGISTGAVSAGATGMAGQVVTEPAPGYGPLANVLLPADTDAVLVALIIPGPCYLLSSRETYALRMFHTIVGGSASARLQRRLRDQLGLVYQARTTLEMHATTGALLVVLSCRPADFADAVKVAADVVIDALTAPIEPAELARAREINRGTHVHDRETAVGRCLVAGLELMRRQQVGHDAELFDLWGEIDATEIAAVAGRVLRPDLVRAAVIGPARIADQTGLAALPGSWRLL